MGYSIALSELVISPAMPSATARGGGVFLSDRSVLKQRFRLLPGPTAGKIGKYLMQVGLSHRRRHLYDVLDIYGRQPLVRRIS